MLEKLKQADEKARRAVIDGVGKTAPKAKISATVSQTMQTALKATIAALTDGDIDLPVVEQGDGPLAPEAYTALVGFQTLMEGLAKRGVPEAKKYVLDAKMAASDNERLFEAAQLVRDAAKDSALQSAIRRAPPEAATPEAPAEPAPAAPAPSKAEQLTQAMMPQQAAKE